ncbi:hypothetical protein ACFXHD_09505 [Streptomyces hydrogenans]|uniref:hypothetical protein n=1 Tax=Streptomyces hydrogenans TaxID=1873719 RepID=UPI0036C8D133
MFQLPDNAPWWALLAVAVFLSIIYGGIQFWRHTWPQNSRDRRAVIEGWQRDRAERRKELGSEGDQQDR